MAEAHQAVAFSFAITHEGVHVNYDREVLHVIFHSGLRSWTRSIRRIINNVRCGVFPGSISSMFFTVGAYDALYMGRQYYNADFDPSFGIIDILKSHINIKTPIVKDVVCASIPGVGLWLGLCLFMKYSLKSLFMYKGWMYEQRGKGRKISLKSRVWLLAVTLFTKFSKPMLYSYQSSLPRLPLPALNATLNRYLRSVRPLLNDEEYAKMEKLAKEFELGPGRKFQRYLVLKSWWATNYVSDWWEEFVYLRGRSPLMVNSNFYGTDAILIHPTHLQCARAANVCHLAFIFRRLIDRQTLGPIMVQGTVPLCSSQYERTFNTTRIPGKETDKVVHFSDSTHIVVYSRGKYYRVPCYYKGQLLNPKELQRQFEFIVNEKSNPDDCEAKLGALTAGDRSSWAEARCQYFRSGVNKTSLETIEKAAFVLILEDDDYDYDAKDASQLDRFGHAMLHGKGYDRWYDKSFNIIVMKNGRIGFNAEHSWADAAVVAHLWEYIMAEDVLEDRYDSDGNCRGEARFEPPQPVELKWNISPELQMAIESSFRVANALLNDVDLRLVMFTAFGKGFIKTCKLSPDAFIQMSLQLAYYRDAGKFNLTYEASMTRLFREGRTETVRPCTIESSAWVRSMEDKCCKNADRISLLRKACARHQSGYQDAMCGKGIDRHLFCLYVISKYLEIDSPFLNKVLSEPWRLSTSQTPHGQTNKLDLTKHPDCISAGGGFGPVADDGYGVSYIIAGEDTLFFHVSSKKSSPVTNSSTFAKRIEKALIDMKNLFNECN
ncbi:UNVERIFIED_CONTAM: hypothetical protein RMT77_005726 [Armadillidium vulgare]